MIKLIFNLLLKKGWMLFSNLLISFCIFKLIGPEEWGGILVFFSLNLLGLILGSGIKSKTSLSNLNLDVSSNYYCMVFINIVSVIFIFIFSFLKDINDFYIVISSILLMVLTNMNSFYQGLMIKDDLIGESTKILIEANIFKLVLFFLLICFYKSIYVLFFIQIFEQIFIFLKQYRKNFYVFSLRNIFLKFKELGYIAIGSAPFLITLSNFQLDLDKYLSKAITGYIGFFSQILNSLRGLLVFLVTNLQKKMMVYTSRFTKITIFISFCLLSNIVILFFIKHYFSIEVFMTISLILLNFVYCMILVLGNIQNILNYNAVSFFSAIFFFIISLLYYVLNIMTYTPFLGLLIYIFCMLFRTILVYFYLRKKIL